MLIEHLRRHLPLLLWCPGRAQVRLSETPRTRLTAATKHTYQWRSSDTKVEYPKLKLRRRQYGTHWVAFDKKPKH